MVVGAVADAPQTRFAPAHLEAVARLSRWLLVAVAIDLLLTRFVVRLAIFVPKGEPWATLGAGLGRIGAATDALVPVVGVILLGALLVSAGRRRDRAEGALLMTLAVVAAGGMALVRFPPTPAVAAGLDLLVVVVAVAAGARLRGVARISGVAALGLVLMTAALALAGVGRLVDLGGVGVGASDGPSGSAPGLAVSALGQLAFVAGVALLGLGGLILARRTGVAARPYVAVSMVVALGVAVASSVAPATWGALLIWSVGLSGSVPAVAVALAIGLAVGGLPAFCRQARGPAVGATIVVLAGYGLAASGLVLAGLLGLIVARPREPLDGARIRASPAPVVARSGGSWPAARA